MSLILDSGAFLAVERDDREVLALLKLELISRRVPITHGGVIGQVWRGTARQARLARFLRTVEITPLDEDLGRRSGVLLGRSRTADIIDAAVILLAEDGDSILTSDANDLRLLARTAGIQLDLIPV